MTATQEDKDVDKSNANAESIKINNVISSLKHVLLLERFVGIYRITLKDGQLLPPNWIKKAFALCLIALYITLYSVFLDLPAAVGGGIDLVEVLDEIPCIVILIQYLITLISANVLFSKSNIEMFIKLADLDSRLIAASSDEFYQKARVKTNRFLLLLAGSHIAIALSDLVTSDEIDAGVIIFLPLYLIQKLEIVVFCLIIETLKSRLDIINGYIAKFLEDKDSCKMSVFTVYGGKEVVKEKFNMIGYPSEDNMKIRDLATMYDALGEICSLINSVFNFQIFMTLGSTFVYIIITIWTVLYVYKTPEINSGPLVTIAIWCVATLMTVAMMCFVCERLRLTRNTAKVLVNQVIMDYSLPNTMRVQAKAFMELIEAWPLRILIYDMFSVDITLMLKFISVSTTYLIVLIQISHFT